MDLAGKTYWLVGASEGLGRALAQEMDAAGARLILSARSEDRLADLARSLNGPAEVLPMDITDLDSVATAWDSMDRARLDGVVFLAGFYEPMDARQWDHDDALRMADVNFMGAMRVVGHVVPSFAARDHGHIVIIGSLAGYRGLPGAIGYGASKAGVMHLAESIHADLHGSGVRTQLINPGFIRTRLTEKNSFEMPFIQTPEEAAKATLSAMKTRRFKSDFPWLFATFFRIGRVLPDWLYLRLFASGGATVSSRESYGKTLKNNTESDP